MVNVNKLKGKMVENEMSVAMLSEKIGLDKSNFYRKMNNRNGETFTVKEANLICKELNLTSLEAMAIFFRNLVA